MSNISFHRHRHGPVQVLVPSLGSWYTLWFLIMMLWWNPIPVTLAYSNLNSLLSLQQSSSSTTSSSSSASTTTSWYRAHSPSTPLLATIGSSVGMKRRRLNDRRLLLSLHMSPPKDSSNEPPLPSPSPPPEGINPITKASWYAVEWFGKTFGPSRRVRQQQPNNTTATATPTNPTTATLLVYYNNGLPPQSLEETIQRIQLDNDRSYFLSGQVDEAIYDPNCVFRDPFVSFVGRDRFVTNLANLGSFITKYSAKVLQYTQPNDTTIQTKIMVKLELNLPWKPILAWPWGVTYTIDPNTYCIMDHEESWDIEPWEGVQQIFRKPTLKL